MTIGLLFKALRILREGKFAVQFANKACVASSINRSHQITNLRLLGYEINLPFRFKSVFMNIFCQIKDLPAEISCKQKIFLQQKHIRVDVKKTESDSSMTQGFKC